jgi:hypothetical protein
VEKEIVLVTSSSKEQAMTTYIFFDDALRMLVNAFLISAVMLIAASGIGLAVIETMERTGVRQTSPKQFR